MDFNGVNNRYGQVAAPDFLDYLCAQSPKLSQVLKFNSSTHLQCSLCKWVSLKAVADVSLKLYFPSDAKQVALHELVDYSSKAVLARSEAVYCGHCDAKTTHTLSRDSDPDLFAVELIRVIDSNGWIKNDSMVTFPVTGLALPGFTTVSGSSNL